MKEEIEEKAEEMVMKSEMAYCDFCGNYEMCYYIGENEKYCRDCLKEGVHNIMEELAMERRAEMTSEFVRRYP